MHRVKINRALLMVVLGSAMVLDGGSTSVLAQERPVYTLEEVTVTARRVEETGQSVPIAITALSGEQLEQRGVRSIYDLKESVPGLHVTTFQAADSLVVGIRGQRYLQVQPGQDPAIGVYFADVPTGFQWGMNLGLFDLANLQTLKGPQGTLFGRNSTGGALLINPAMPTDIFEGSIRTGISGFDQGGFGFTSTSIVNVPVSDTLSLRIALDTVNTGGYLKNIADPAIVAAATPPHSTVLPWPYGKTNFKNLGNQDSMSWRVGLLWQAATNLESYLVYEGANLHSNNIAPQIVYVNPDSFLANTDYSGAIGPIGPLGPILDRFQASDEFWSTQTGYHAPLKLDQHKIVSTTTLELGNITIKNIFGWKTVHRRWGSDAEGVPYQNVINDYKQNGYEFSEELQVQGRFFDDTLDVVAGIFYFNNRIHQEIEGDALTYSGRIVDANNLTSAAYLQGTYRLPWIEGLAVTGGVRFTDDIRQLKRSDYSAPGVCKIVGLPPGAPCLAVGKRGFGHWTYTATVNYQIDPETLIYVTDSSGYRAGGFNIAENNVAFFQLGFKPETVINYEAGIKKDWLIGQMPVRTNVALYWQDYTNIVRQARDPNNPAFALLTNATKAVIKGTEIEIQARPTEHLELGIAYAHVDAGYTAPFIVNNVDLQSYAFALVPATTLSLNGAYTLPLDSSYGAVKFSASYYLQSRMYYDDQAQGPASGPLNAQSQKPYSTLNLRLDWLNVMGSNFDLDAWVRNVAATKYYTSAVPLYGSLGVWPAYVGLPRQFGLGVKYNF